MSSYVNSMTTRIYGILLSNGPEGPCDRRNVGVGSRQSTRYVNSDIK